MPYLGKQSEQVGVSVQKYEFLQGTDSSSGATSFSVPSDSADHLSVWLNGVLLVEGAAKDYTTTNSTVDFVTAPADDDIVRIDVVESFALPDALKSSGDVMSGTLKLNGGIQQQTSADLSGTYAYHQLMLSDAFTVAGDVTISDNLVLAKLSDDSNPITISNDTSGTRTITGTGSLEASTLAQTPNASLTGMTGELGSAVTGSPNISLENRNFLNGQIVQVQGKSLARVTGAGSEDTTVISQEITLLDYANNDVLIVINGVVSKNTSGGTGAHFGTYVEGGSLGSGTSGVLYAQQLLYQLASSTEESVGIHHWDKTPPSATNTYGLYLKAQDSAQTTHTQWSIAIYEIKR